MRIIILAAPKHAGMRDRNMLSIAIQAGGQSSRMGRDKALVPLMGKPLIEHVLERISGLSDEILITTNRPRDYAYLGFPTAQDSSPGAGALAGLKTALQASLGERVLVLACDLPFVSKELLKHLIGLSDQADVTIPYRNGKYEPFVAVYAKTCVAAIDESLKAGEMRMISFYPLVKVLALDEQKIAALDPDGLSFFNINTPDDLSKAERILNRLE